MTLILNKMNVFLNLLKNFINSKKLKSIFFYTFLFGILAYGYMYFNSNFSHDSMTYLYDDNYARYLSMGRFIRPLCLMIKGNLTLPVLNGFLSLLFLSFCNYFLIEILNIKNKISMILVCGIMTVNYSMSILNATFIHDVDANMFSLLCVYIAMYLLINKKSLINSIISILLFVTSLGIYQSYIEVAIGLFIILAIVNILEKKDTKIALKKLFICLLHIALSMIIYYVLYKLLLSVFNISASSYHNPEEIFSISFDKLLSLDNAAIHSLVNWYLYPRSIKISYIQVINCCLTIVLALGFLKLTISNKLNFGEVLIALTLLAMLPIGLSCIQFISSTAHEITVYAYFIIYVFIIKTIELCDKNKNFFSFDTYVLFGVYLLISVVLFDGIKYSNSLALKKELEEQSTLSLFTRIIDRIEQYDGYEPGVTKVAIVSSDSDITYNRDGMNFSGVGIEHSYSVYKPEQYSIYFNEYLGYSINIVSLEDNDIVSNSQEILNMPCFPEENCTKYINDVLVIKIPN